jgi:hypothetical protein
LLEFQRIHGKIKMGYFNCNDVWAKVYGENFDAEEF